jgi:sugar lactone lactonase YvrE
VRIAARAAFAAAVTVALTAGGPAALAQASGHNGGDDGPGAHGAQATKVFTLEDSATAGNPEGVAYDKRSKAFFTGGTGDGTIFRGTLADPTVHVFIPGATGGSAIGMKVSHGKLYVAGGGTGLIKVYDIATKALLATFDTGAGGFLNDLVVTEHGDVWVTDSFRPTLWHVTGDQVKAGTGEPDPVDVSAITFTAGAFNLNGIVATHDGKRLVVVQSNTGALWSINVKHTPVSIEQIDAPPLVGGDGMIVDKGRLVVVVGSTTPPNLTFLKLNHHGSRARVDKVVTDPTLRGPSTVARAEGTYLVVNADFGTSTKPFTISGLARHQGGHGDGHGDGHGGGHR